MSSWCFATTLILILLHKNATSNSRRNMRRTGAFMDEFISNTRPISTLKLPSLKLQEDESVIPSHPCITIQSDAPTRAATQLIRRFLTPGSPSTPQGRVCEVGVHISICSLSINSVQIQLWSFRRSYDFREMFERRLQEECSDFPPFQVHDCSCSVPFDRHHATCLRT